MIVIVVGIMLFFMLKEKDEDAPEKATVDSATEKSKESEPTVNRINKEDVERDKPDGFIF
jgi:hypothetical protein